ncbi:MAG: VOC family protein [Rhizobiaceae bacterium]
MSAHFEIHATNVDRAKSFYGGLFGWALASGGAEALPPENYPGVGRCAYVEDGEGNIVGMITPENGAQ